MIRLFFSLLTLTFFLGCTSSDNSSDESTSGAEETPQMQYTLTPFDPSQEFTDAAITSMEYVNGRFDFGIGGEGYQLGVQTPDAPSKGCANSAQGQHIHLIIDNLPYAAKYEAGFDYEIPDGEHHLLAFLSRSYHESIKSDDAHVALKVEVASNGITSQSPVGEPMLFYSRPKGVYTGDDTKRVMLDYYLINANPKHKVQADINGEIHLLDAWQPYYIDGLPAGDNQITLLLVDENGKRVNTDLNPVTRKFVLNPDPTTGG